MKKQPTTVGGDSDQCFAPRKGVRRRQEQIRSRRSGGISVRNQTKRIPIFEYCNDKKKAATLQVLLRHIKFIQRLRYGPILGRISKMHRLKQGSGASFFLAIDGSFLQAHIRRNRCRAALAVYRRGNNASGVARALTAGIKTGMLQVLKRKCVAHNANRRRRARLGRNK